MFRSLATLCVVFSAFMASPVVTPAEDVWKQYPSSVVTALAYDGENFWIGKESTILKWHKDRGVIAEYSSKEGFPGSKIHGIFIAPDKTTIWAATDSSIARFDGSAWHTVSVQEGGPSSSVGKVVFEPNGTIWILTDDGTGVYRCIGSVWTHFTESDGLSSNSANDIAVDTDGIVWIGTDKGVSSYDGKGWKVYTTTDGLPENVVTHVVVDKNNVKWFGIGGELGGVARFDGVTWTAYNMTNGMIGAKSISGMVVGPDNILWVSLCDIRYSESVLGEKKPANGIYRYYAYLYKFDGGIVTRMKSRVSEGYLLSSCFTPLIVDNSGKLYIISDIPSEKAILGYDRKDPVCDADNVIWFIENEWLASYNGNVRNGYGFDPPADAVRALAVGPDNEIWVAFSPGGIAEFADNTWKITPYEYSPFYDTSCLSIDKEGDAWLGGNSSALIQHSWTSSSRLDSPLPDYFGAQSMAFDRNNTLWVSFSYESPVSGQKENYLFGYDGTAWSRYTTADGLVNDEVHAIAVDSGNARWFGTSAGISRYDGTSWTSFTTTGDDTPIGRVTTLAFDAHDTLWAGTGNGLLRYDGSTWTRFTPNEGLADTLVLSLATGPDGVVWAGTPKGLSRYDGTSWKTFTTADGLPGDRVQALAVDHNQVVWVGTDRGLVSYREENGVFVDDTPGVPVAFPTVSVYPNPFNPSTIIECILPAGNRSDLAIYSLSGQKVRTLTAEYLSPGKHQFRWDGKNDSGHSVSSGVYITRLKSGNISAVSKMVLVK